MTGARGSRSPHFFCDTHVDRDQHVTPPDTLSIFFLSTFSSKWILCCFTQRRDMLRCDVHFKELRAPFVTATPAALGIFRVENKQPENVWNATWPFNLTRRRGFSQIPTERCWRARLSCTQQTGAQCCGFSKPQPCCPSLLFPPTSRNQSAHCCSSEAFPPRSVLPHEPVRWMQNKCKSGPLSKLPPGVTGKQRSSSPQHLAFVEPASVSHHVVSHLDKLLLLGETFCPFWDMGLFFRANISATTGQKMYTSPTSVRVSVDIEPQ